jgi:23S rRNA (uracil1939-C5)-methyltransferase
MAKRRSAPRSSNSHSGARAGFDSGGYQRGALVELTIESMAPGGEAFARAGTLPVFIGRGAPGDLARVELYDVRKNFAKGKIESLIKPSDDRAEPPCKLFKVCGGCQWQHLAYEKQLEHKTGIVKQALVHIGGLDASVVKPCLGADDPLHYRNKVQFPVRNPQGSNRILAGYYKQDSHELVNIKHCPVQSAELDFMLETVKEVLEEYEISAYDERKRQGLVRHIHDRAGNRILGDVTELIAGSDSIEEVLQTSNPNLPSRLQKGLTFTLSATSFFQVNTEQAVKLLEIAYLEAFDEIGAGEKLDVVVDAYAGVGAISLWLAERCRKLIAVEEYKQAVLDGRANAEKNAIENVEFVEGDVADVLPQLSARAEKVDLVVLDPPRKGVSPSVIQSLLDLAPPRIVYVSCNPATLARDLKYLSLGIAPANSVSKSESEENAQPGGAVNVPCDVAPAADGKPGKYGYKTVRIQPVDLFPQTYHVESVATLERVLLDGSL